MVVPYKEQLSDLLARWICARTIKCIQFVAEVLSETLPFIDVAHVRGMYPTASSRTIACGSRR
jgi:hypothetical protein